MALFQLILIEEEKMKKFAYIIMGAQYTPDTQQARFETTNSATYIFTVRNFSEAQERALICLSEGFGVIELCGAFGETHARELVELTKNKMGIGFVINLPEQEELFHAFFNN